jgi:hypothetical protein
VPSRQQVKKGGGMEYRKIAILKKKRPTKITQTLETKPTGTDDFCKHFSNAFKPPFPFLTNA